MIDNDDVMVSPWFECLRDFDFYRAGDATWYFGGHSDGMESAVKLSRDAIRMLQYVIVSEPITDESAGRTLEIMDELGDLAGPLMWRKVLDMWQRARFIHKRPGEDK